MNNPSHFFEDLGVTMDQARRFCILKYTARMKIGDKENHKEIENDIASDQIGK